MKKTITLALLSAGLLAAFRPALPPTEALKTEALQDLQAHYAEYQQVAQRIWGFAEMGYKETKSSALLQETLRKNGFTVQAGVADIPTAFVATYGSGQPVIGILAEYDALPGLAQNAVAEKSPIAGQNAGHGCGHNLFGTASVAAGIEIKKLLKEGKLHGTVKVYGCPAEEGGSGKVYLVRAGLFEGVDAVLHWHPGSENATMVGKYIANSSAKFRFTALPRTPPPRPSGAAAPSTGWKPWTTW